MNMNPDFFPRNLSLAHNLIKTEPGKDEHGKRKDKNRIPGLLQQSKINEEDLTPEERERRERERRLNSKPPTLECDTFVVQFLDFGKPCWKCQLCWKIEILKFSISNLIRGFSMYYL